MNIHGLFFLKDNISAVYFDSLSWFGREDGLKFLDVGARGTTLLTSSHTLNYSVLST